MGDFIPYCGYPPVPGALTWNTDPILISGLIAAGALYALRCLRPGAPTGRERMLFAAGLLVVAAALISPLCNLSVALFSARVTQHVILTLIGAPLIVLGRADLVIEGLRPRANGRKLGGWDSRATGVTGGIAFAAAMWTWHLPGPYDATLQNNVIYWLMHITTFGSAVLLWHGLLLESTASAGSALVVGVGTATQISLLGAILAFAPKALFAVHFGTTFPWGLSPIEDQQLGAAILWVPAGLLFTAYAIAAFAGWLNGIDTPVTGKSDFAPGSGPTN